MFMHTLPLTREVFLCYDVWMSEYNFEDYKALHSLYTKQLMKTDELQLENMALYNRVLELQQTVDKWEVKGK